MSRPNTANNSNFSSKNKQRSQQQAASNEEEESYVEGKSDHSMRDDSVAATGSGKFEEAKQSDQ